MMALQVNNIIPPRFLVLKTFYTSKLPIILKAEFLFTIHKDIVVFEALSVLPENIALFKKRQTEGNSTMKIMEFPI